MELFLSITTHTKQSHNRYRSVGDSQQNNISVQLHPLTQDMLVLFESFILFIIGRPSLSTINKSNIIYKSIQYSNKYPYNYSLLYQVLLLQQIQKRIQPPSVYSNVILYIISTIPSIDPTATTLAVIPSGEPTDYLSCSTIVIAIVHTYKY